MIDFNNKLKNKIKEHALKESPQECCGLIVQKEGMLDAYSCRNRAQNKNDFFEIDPNDYLSASKTGEIVAYYHSHTEHESEFSNFDKFISDIHGFPTILYSIKHDKFKEYFPV
jgi:proteasome lid subunit RPN8/RPN11